MHPRSGCLRSIILTQFTDFGLAQPVLKALEEAGYTTPTPIQAQAIRPAMEGRDLCGIAQTGTGKTAAFALPILHRLEPREAPRAAPRLPRAGALADPRARQPDRRELLAITASTCRCTNTVVFGGVTIGRQERALAPGVDILVATPGPADRSRRPPLADAAKASRSSSSTRPTRCSTSASSMP